MAVTSDLNINYKLLQCTSVVTKFTKPAKKLSLVIVLIQMEINGPALLLKKKEEWNLRQ